MAIIRITPVRDAFISDGTLGSKRSVGQDELLELGRDIEKTGTTGSMRTLLQFDTDEIRKAVAKACETRTSKEVGLKANLHLYNCLAENLVDSYTIDCYDLTENWFEGYGRINDKPDTSAGGTTWIDRYPGTEWHVTGSSYAPDSIVSSEFTYLDNKDLDLDITPIVGKWLTAENNGLMLKLRDEEYACKYFLHLIFYGTQTHTTYRPYLEFKWDDSVFETEALPVPDNEPLIVNIRNLEEQYRFGDNIRLDIRVRLRYPARVYSTSSIYDAEQYVLPEGSLWGIKDEYTEEMVIPFNPVATKLSADSKGNFFNLDTNLLEPERYYRLLFRYGTKTLDNKNIFKVVRNGCD